MFQGDKYKLGIRILNNAGNPVTGGDAQDVEITIGDLTKNRATGVTYDDTTAMWLFPVEPEETFAMQPGPLRAQVRVKWKNYVVEGKPLYGMRMDESISAVESRNLYGMRLDESISKEVL